MKDVRLGGLSFSRARASGSAAGRSLARLCTVAAAVGALSACALGRPVGRNLGAGAVDGLVARDTALLDLERRLTDSAGAFIRRALASAVLEPTRATLDTMARMVRGSADSAARLLARRIEGDVSRSIRQLLEQNLDVLDARGTALARSTARSLTDEIGRELGAILAQAGDSLARRTVGGLAAGLRDVLEPVLHQVMQAVTDSLRNRIRQVDTTVARSETVGGIRYGLFGGSAVLLLWVGAVGVWHWRRQRRALDAVIDAVNARADPALHEAVRSCASRAGVQEWLGSRVEARGRDAEPPRRTS